SQLDWSLIHAATIVPALLLIHSLVDFPLRTGANLAIMAFACALLIEPPIGASKTTAEAKLQVPRLTRNRDRRRLEPRLSSTKLATKPNLPSPSRPTSQSPSHPTSQRWGADFKWPKEWSKETPASDEGAEEKAQEKPASGAKTPESSADATEADP